MRVAEVELGLGSYMAMLTVDDATCQDSEIANITVTTLNSTAPTARATPRGNPSTLAVSNGVESVVQ